MTSLISVEELARLLLAAAGDPPTLLDVRWRLSGPPGIEAYQAGHVPGAVFVDLDRDLAGPPGPGGRHPMPSAAAFQAAMRRAGVSDGRLVVVYDDADSTAAARAWWLLRYFGHPRVRVLDGGYRAWTAAGQRSAISLHGTAPAAPVPPATSPPAQATCRCSTRPARPRSPAPACCSTPGRASGTGARTSRSTR